MYRRKASEKEPPVALPLASIAELHSFYRELIYKLIQLENPDLKEKEIQPLSQPSLILLEEFALRKYFSYTSHFFRIWYPWKLS
jgi:hypothetical protein